MKSVIMGLNLTWDFTWLWVDAALKGEAGVEVPASKTDKHLYNLESTSLVLQSDDKVW